MKPNLATHRKLIDEKIALCDKMGLCYLRNLLVAVRDDSDKFEGALRQRLLDITCDGSKPHDVCCVLCLEKGESMAIQKMLGDAEDTMEQCQYASKNEWGPTTDCNYPTGDGFCEPDSCPKKDDVEDTP